MLTTITRTGIIAGVAVVSATLGLAASLFLSASIPTTILAPGQSAYATTIVIEAAPAQ